METKINQGLAGVIAGDSSICKCGEEEETLTYRGYTIEDLADKSSFEEVAFLLTRGKLPTKKELTDYQKKLYSLRDIPKPIKEILEKIPKKTSMMDLLRTATSLLGNFEPETKEHSSIDIIDRLMSVFPSLLLYWYTFHEKRKKLSLETNELSLAGHFLHLLYEKPPEEFQKRALDISLILYAEHEFNASTFTVRTIGSTLSDIYSAICGGIGALRGPLHGGANEKAIEHILSYEKKEIVCKNIQELLRKKELIFGFGHRVYRTKDPRSSIIKEVAKTFHHPFLFEIANEIEKTMWEEKKLFPNLDFYSALVYHELSIPIQMFTPLFVFSRISGWGAHFLEQRENNKLIRPLSHYTGPEKKTFIPIEERC